MINKKENEWRERATLWFGEFAPDWPEDDSKRNVLRSYGTPQQPLIDKFISQSSGSGPALRLPIEKMREILYPEFRGMVDACNARESGKPEIINRHHWPGKIGYCEAYLKMDLEGWTVKEAFVWYKENYRDEFDEANQKTTGAAGCFKQAMYRKHKKEVTL